MIVEGIPAWGVGAVGDVVCGIQKFPIGGKRFVFGFELDWHCCDLFLSEWFVFVGIWVEAVGLQQADRVLVVACDLPSDVHWFVIEILSGDFCWGGS